LAIISANTLNFARTLGCTHKQTHNHEIEATTSIVLRRTHLLGCVSHLVRVVLPPGDGTQRRCWREGPICTPTVSAENAPYGRRLANEAERQGQDECGCSRVLA